ncbi:phospholipase A and acyltransferase 1-like [Dreissena polymorpha]|uniref:phospholipase A and acyltransferase 1-like n=1 Tax=Dreissena polymorpha TaxID=45954 RepID=UPI002263F028|nr:phospholipase A and acyltransferase 1-like [Dreissena polymorpha]
MDESEDESFLEKLLQPAFRLVRAVKRMNEAFVHEDSFLRVAANSKAKKNNSKDSDCKPLLAKEIVKRAKESICQAGYNLLLNNCEHFATYCRYGKAESEQARPFEGVAAVVTSKYLWRHPLLYMWDLATGN